MGQFLLHCFFKECYKGPKFGVSTLCYAKSRDLMQVLTSVADLGVI
jgi:hypothetical protein